MIIKETDLINFVSCPIKYIVYKGNKIKMTNPKTAVDAILDSENKIDGITIYPMTLARYALLELVESPFVTPNVKFTISNLVPSFFICCSPIDQLKGINSKNIDKLNDRALEWAETLP